MRIGRIAEKAHSPQLHQIAHLRTLQCSSACTLSGYSFSKCWQWKQEGNWRPNLENEADCSLFACVNSSLPSECEHVLFHLVKIKRGERYLSSDTSEQRRKCQAHSGSCISIRRSSMTCIFEPGILQVRLLRSSDNRQIFSGALCCIEPSSAATRNFQFILREQNNMNSARNWKCRRLMINHY